MKSQIKNELVAFKCPTPFKNKLVKYANLEMVSISDIIRRGTIAEVANLDAKYKQSRNSTWLRVKEA